MYTTVVRWVQRTQGKRLDRVDFKDQPRGPKRPHNRSSRTLEDQILKIRHELRTHSVLGEYGANAIHRQLQTLDLDAVPSIRTIGRILQRRGALDRRQRVRHPAPPKGWYLPDVAVPDAELDLFDYVEQIYTGGKDLIVLNVVSLHGGQVGSFPAHAFRSKSTRYAMTSHWKGVGLPVYAQFDNDRRFTGPEHYPDTVGVIIRFCLTLGVTPVFAVPNEPGFQAAIESYNARWQSKVWSRYHFTSLAQIQSKSREYVHASRRRSASRRETAIEAALSEWLAVQPSPIPYGKDCLSEACRRSGSCQSPRPPLRCRFSLVPPSCTVRSRHRPLRGKILCPEKTRS